MPVEEADAAERKAPAVVRVLAFAQNKFRTAATHIHDDQPLSSQRGVGHHALINPLRLLVAGNDFHRQAGAAPDGGHQLVPVYRVARGAGGDDASGDDLMGSGQVHEGGRRLRGPGDGLGLKAVGFVKAMAQARLLALLPHGLNPAARDFRHEQLGGVGADINDGATLWLHDSTTLTSGEFFQRENARKGRCHRIVTWPVPVPGAITASTPA